MTKKMNQILCLNILFQGKKNQQNNNNRHISVHEGFLISHERAIPTESLGEGAGRGGERWKGWGCACITG
jgi:hypothetical protein